MAGTKQADPFEMLGGKKTSKGSQPLLHQHGKEVQRFGQMRLLPIALSHDARMESCQLWRAANC